MQNILTPLYDRLLVKKDEKKNTIAGDIVLPDQAKEEVDRGVIICAGHGRLLMDGTVAPLLCKPGDAVLFGKYSGTEVKLDGVEYIILSEPELLGIFPVKDV